MTGTNNQLQSPIVLSNSGVVFTGTLAVTTASQAYYTLSAQYQVMNDGVIVQGITCQNLVSGTVVGLTSINYGTCSILASIGSTYSNCTSIVGNSVISITNGVSNTGPALTTFTMPNLTYIVAVGFSPIWAVLVTLSLPSLKLIGGAFAPTLALCTTLTLTSLQNISSNFGLIAASLTTLSLPALLNVGTTFAITAANMTTFSMNAGLLSIGGNFTMTGMKLDQASVDGILVSLAALDGTNGTTAFSNLTVNLSGGTSSAPSATGLTAKATLVGRGCTVTTN
jgi:hypothetical protein